MEKVDDFLELIHTEFNLSQLNLTRLSDAVSLMKGVSLNKFDEFFTHLIVNYSD